MGWGDSPRGHGWERDIDFIDVRLREYEISFDLVYSSDLERSRKTAEIHAKNLGIPDIGDSPQLNEINYGKLQKMKKRWVPRFFPQHKKNPDLEYPSGESFRQMQQRSTAFLSSLVELHSRQTVLIVTHAGVIRGIVSHYLGLDYATNLDQRIPFRYIGDYRFEGEEFLRYDELGEASGFVENSIVDLPFIASAETR